MNNKTKILGILWVFPLIMCSCETDKRTNAEQYLDQITECRNNSDFHSQLFIFPETLNGEIVKYFYMEESDIFTGSYFLYLVLDYDLQTYNSEIARLEQVKAEFTKFNKTKFVISYPEEKAYLTIFKDNRFEYALYDSNKLEIAYVSNQLFTWDRAQVLPEHNMPNFKIPTEIDDGNNSYNMYYHYVDNVGWEITD